MTVNDSDDFLDFVDQAIFEMDERAAYAQDDSGTEEDFAGMLPVYQQILAELKKWHAAVRAGTHPFGGGRIYRSWR